MNLNDIRKLKYDRLSPEHKYAVSLLDGLQKHDSLLPDIFYTKNNICYFYIDNTRAKIPIIYISNFQDEHDESLRFNQNVVSYIYNKLDTILQPSHSYSWSFEASSLIKYNLSQHGFSDNNFYPYYRFN